MTEDSEPDPLLIDAARSRLLRRSSYSLTAAMAKDPGSAFIALLIGGGGIGLVVWLGIALVFGVESPLALFAGIPVLLLWISSRGQKDHVRDLEAIRDAKPMTIVYRYCEEVPATEDPDLWRALDDLRDERYR